MRTGITTLAAALFMTICTLQAQQSATTQTPVAGRGAAPSSTPAPPPGSAGIYKSDAELTEALKKAIAAANGNQSSSPIANTDQYRINIVHREKPAGALAHEGNTELHYIIEGEGVVVTGGMIVRGAGGINGATIQGGEAHYVKKGDVLIVPSGSAHWYKEVTTPNHVSRSAIPRTKIDSVSKRSPGQGGDPGRSVEEITPVGVRLLRVRS